MYALVFDKADVPIGRLAVFALLATFAFTVTTLLWDPIRRFGGWLLLPLGQNALTAYSVHVFVVAATTKLTITVFGARQPSALWATALAVAGVAFVWAFVRLEPKAKERLKAVLTAPAAPGRYDSGLKPAASEDKPAPKDMVLT